MMDGWIALHRKFLEWEWYDDVNTKVLFIHCLLKANHKEKQWQGNTIKRGQFITGLPTLAKETGLSIQEVRTALGKLKKTKEIKRQSNRLFSIITICKYDTYQDIPDESNSPSNIRATDGQQTSNRRATTTNNDNNDNNENNETNKKEIYKESFENENQEFVPEECNINKFDLRRDKTPWASFYTDKENKQLMSDIEDVLKATGERLSAMMMATNISNENTMSMQIDKYLTLIYGRGEFYNSEFEIRKHCINWINKNKN